MKRKAMDLLDINESDRLRHVQSSETCSQSDKHCLWQWIEPKQKNEMNHYWTRHFVAKWENRDQQQENSQAFTIDGNNMLRLNSIRRTGELLGTSMDWLLSQRLCHETVQLCHYVTRVSTWDPMILKLRCQLPIDWLRRCGTAELCTHAGSNTEVTLGTLVSFVCFCLCCCKGGCYKSSVLFTPLESTRWNGQGPSVHCKGKRKQW